ncbi:MAG: hypothetical protein ABIO84_06660, partial [Lysobacter sp.]
MQPLPVSARDSFTVGASARAVSAATAFNQGLIARRYSVRMLSIGPFPLPAAMLAVSLVVAVIVARQFGRRE